MNTIRYKGRDLTKPELTETDEDAVKKEQIRAKRVFESLYLSHLNDGIKEYVALWTNIFPDILHLNGVKPTAPHLVQHRISMPEDRVTQRKQYQRAQDSAEDTRQAVEKQLKSAIIRPSKSPYNSTEMIILRNLMPQDKKIPGGYLL